MRARIPPVSIGDSRFVVLSGFLFGISIFHRDFAHLAIVVAGVPLFPGELTLGALMALEGVRLLRARRMPFRAEVASVLWALYLGLGLVFAIVGLQRGFGLAALRDAALVYYAVLFFLAQSIVRANEHPARIFAPVAIGAALGSTWTVASFLLSPQLTYEHGATGFQALAAWLGLAYLAANPALSAGRWRPWRWAGAVPLVLVIYLAGYRTMIGAAAASLAATAGWALLARGPALSPIRRLLMLGAAFCLVFVTSVAVARSGLGEPAPGSATHGEVALVQGLRVITDRWVRLFRGGEGAGPEDASATFRAIAWAEAVARIRAQPWTGIGFGPEPALYPSSYCDAPESPISNCGNAHNTYLTLAMRMGIPGFGLWAVGSLWVVGGYLRATLTRRNDEALVREAAFLCVVLVSLLVFGFFSLFFESPYLSPFYWVTLGVMAEAARRLRDQQAGGAARAPGLVSGAA